MNKIDGIQAARTFIENYYPDCTAALLFGSVARGEATPTSDLDILILIEHEEPFCRKSYRDFGWFIETFVGSRKFYEEKIRYQGKIRNPSLLYSFAEAIILRDHINAALTLKESAITTLRRGPKPLTQQETDEYRYVITDWLDDLADSKIHSEALFIAPELVVKSAELLLAYNMRWSGERRWLFRALRQLDDKLADQLVEGLSGFYKTGRKDLLIGAAESILNLAGGRLYEGFVRMG